MHKPSLAVTMLLGVSVFLASTALTARQGQRPSPVAATAVAGAEPRVSITPEPQRVSPVEQPGAIAPIDTPPLVTLDTPSMPIVMTGTCADSVVVFGPRRYESASSSLQTDFLDDADFSIEPGRRYVLEVVNSGLSTMIAGFNGVEMIGIDELGASPIARVLNAFSENALEIHVTGTIGTFADVRIVHVPEPTYTIASHTFTKTFSSNITWTFSLPAGSPAPYTMHVRNGMDDGLQRMDHATIKLNRVQIVSGSELTDGVATLSRTVTLTPLDTIVVGAGSSDVASFITVTITATDTTPPSLAITAPANGTIVDRFKVLCTGTVVDAQTWEGLEVADQTLTLGGGGAFSDSVFLANEGTNVLHFVARNGGCQTVDSTRVVVRDTKAPHLVVKSPAADTVVYSASPPSFTVVGNWLDTTNTVITVNGDTVIQAQSGAFVNTRGLSLGHNTLTIRAVDAVGHMTTILRSVLVASPNDSVPIDPRLVAPSIDTTVVKSHLASTRFLYTGGNPIIRGHVVEDSLKEFSVATVRGRVLSRDGQALWGAKVQIADHPEYGYTFSRQDGGFDLVVNGGEWLTVEFEKNGHLPAQRIVSVPWRNFVQAPDVVLVGVDPIANTIVFSDPYEVARGTPIDGTDGDTLDARRATLLFESGTEVKVYFNNGTDSLVASSINVRATELSVGPNGPKAMPASLPPTTAYTYCVGLDVDTALALGAERVTFDKPVPFYVENFLHFRVGDAVPVGSFDRERGVWRAELDARVIEIVSREDDVAEIDITGDGEVEADTVLAVFGLDVPERQMLASLYPDGTELWRAELTHFTEYDFNPPWQFLAGGGIPNPGPIVSGDFNDCVDCTPIAELENQVAGEDVPVTGTPFDLVYNSARTNDYLAGSEIDIPLTASSIEGSLRRVELEVDVAGQHHTFSFAPASNLQQTFRWDGLDAYGRRLNGRVPAKVTIRYFYPMVYAMQPGADGAMTWSVPCFSMDCDVPEGAVVQEASRELVQNVMLGGFEMNAAGLGGWSLSPHHAYDPTLDGILYYGDGVRELGLEQRPMMKRLLTAGVTDLAIGPDGGLYFAESNGRIRRLDLATSAITLVAGTGTHGGSGDGGPATSATLGEDPHIAFGPDGSLFVSHNGCDGACVAVRRIRPDGIIEAYAGNGTVGSEDSDDGQPALSVSLAEMKGIAVGPDGSVYTSEAIQAEGGNVVRRISPDGVIYRFAGIRNVPNFGGDNGPAVDAHFQGPHGLAVGPDGSVYISDKDNRRVRRVDPQGIITTFAGMNNPGNTQAGDGGLATSATIKNPLDVTVGPDGSVYIADPGRIRRVAPNGIISTVAGGGTVLLSNQGNVERPSRLLDLSNVKAVVVDPFGRLIVRTDFSSTEGVAISQTSAQGFGIAAAAISSRDGRELHALDDEGRHQFTIDGMTGDTLFSFRYNSAGQLDSLKDRDGRWTDIERDGETAIAIRSPDGLRTTLSCEGGYLSSVTNPAGNLTGFEYSSGGLLLQRLSPRSHATTYSYDDDGRLVSVEDPEGGLWTLTREPETGGHSMTLTSLEGQETKVTTLRAPTGELYRAYQDVASGLADTLVEGADRSLRSVAADGVVRTATVTADPRFGLRSPVASTTITTPASRELAVVTTRTTNATTDPLVFDQYVETVTVNGDATVRTYDRSARTLTIDSPEGRTVVVELDNAGRPTSIEAANLDPITLHYDANGSLDLAEQGARSWTYAYDDSGRVEAITDATNRNWTFRYDAAGRAIRQTLPDNEALGIDYDDSGNATGITPPGRPLHSFTYTATEQTETYNPPDVGIAPRATAYTYDDDGRLSRIDRPDGQDVDIGYDASGRPETITTPRGTVHFYYRSNGSGAGHPDSVSTPEGPTVVYDYDGDLIEEEVWTGVLSGAVRHTYDDFLRINGQSLKATAGSADTLTVAFDYDDDGLLTGAGDIDFVHDPDNGLLTTATIGSVVTHYKYTTAGELEQDSTVFGGTLLRSATYGRDDAGRITLVSENLSGTRNISAFEYDDVGRLWTVRHDGALVATYTYDANGNRIGVTMADTMTATIDHQDRLIRQGGTAYRYSNAGDLRYAITGASDTTKYSYDPLGNLLQVVLPGGTQIDYVIDGQSRRVGKRVNGTLVRQWLYHNGLNVVAELDGVGNVLSRFVYASKGQVPDYMIKNGATYRLVADHLGSVRRIVDVATGSSAQDIDYNEWGIDTLNTASGFQPFGYAGGLRDVDTKLIRFGARDYDPITGRWTSPDPIRFAAGFVSLYAYAQGDPIDLIDPSGLDVTVTFYPGIPGHIGLGVNTPYTVGYHPIRKTLDVSLNARKPGMVTLDAIRVGLIEQALASSIVIPTSQSQDEVIAAYIRERAADGEKYNILGNNCSRFVAAALRAGGLRAPDRVVPMNLYMDLIRIYHPEVYERLGHGF